MDAERIQEIFSAFGRVSVHRMFGGAGIYFDGTMFGLCDDGVIYLKTDDSLVPDFQQAGSAPFAFTAKGRRVTLSYWRLPDNLYDDADELARWAKRSLAVAQQAASRKAGKKKRPARGRAAAGARRPRAAPSRRAT